MLFYPPAILFALFSGSVETQHTFSTPTWSIRKNMYFYSRLSARDTRNLVCMLCIHVCCGCFPLILWVNKLLNGTVFAFSRLPRPDIYCCFWWSAPFQVFCRFKYWRRMIVMSKSGMKLRCCYVINCQKKGRINYTYLLYIHFNFRIERRSCSAHIDIQDYVIRWSFKIRQSLCGLAANVSFSGTRAQKPSISLARKTSWMDESEARQ